MNDQPRTVSFKKGERNVFFHLLTACNLNCVHCYINKDQHGSQTLSKDTIFSWLKLFADKNKTSNLILLGGEPTMHPDLAETVAYAKELGFVVTVDSNGFLLYDFLQKTSPSVLDYLSFSVDGPDKETNDAIRGKGVFEVCTGNIAKAVQLGYKVSVIYTVSSRNIEKLPEMVPLLTELGVKKFFIQVIGLRGNSSKESGGDDAQVSKQRWLEVVPQVAREAARSGIHVTYPKVFLDPQEEFQCAGETAENYFIFPNGRVYMCPLCEDHPIHAYEIKNNLLMERDGLTEKRFFPLKIEEGCVMNKLLQPDNIEYNEQGHPVNKISCCLLKQEIAP